MSATHFLHPEALVTGAWLEAHLADPSLRIFDCTTYLEYETDSDQPYRVVSGRADYDAGHIPGSAFLDLQAQLSDDASPFRFTMPASARFAEIARPPRDRRGHARGALCPQEPAVGDAGLVDAAVGRLR
jgi:3-mercaptopyruvate sulfurtransferase SseA